MVREGKRLRAVRVHPRPPEAKDAPQSDEAIAQDAAGSTSRAIRLSVEPRSEWRQMFREVWRLQRDQFWVPNMSGNDWDAAFRRYEPLLARVATRGELSDLIWELQGELGTSHAYESGGDHRRPPQIALGHLAAELRSVEGGAGYEIVRIVEGDAWDATADSPLNAIGVQAKVGERIVAVNGQAVARDRPPQALLVNQAGAKVELTLAAGKGGRSAKSTRTVLVTDVGRRSAGALSRMGRAQPQLRSCAIGRSRRLPALAGHDVGGLRRVPSLFQPRSAIATR